LIFLNKNNAESGCLEAVWLETVLPGSIFYLKCSICTYNLAEESFLNTTRAA